MMCPLCQSDNPAQAQRCRACGAPLKSRAADTATAPDALPDGTLLAGTYAIEEVLGQGGFGITYRCHDQMLDRRVAVKEFFPSGCRRQHNEVEPSRGLSDADFREARTQFLAEARTLARCHHVGIVGVHAAFEANSTAYMVMEMLHGKTLAQLLSARGGRMNEAEAVGVIERVGEALQFVHEQNLLHRDIKPDNIIVCDDGRVMLIDFGTARETIQGQVQGHTVVVTPGYAPLEQYAKQARRGAFTDVYSLAATLYHLLSGQMPPAASDRAMGVQLRPLREFNPQISASVAHATQSALEMEIAKRPQSVREFLDLLHAPIEAVELESRFTPQTGDLSSEEENDYHQLSAGAIAATLTPDALRARQQLWQNAMPSGDAQPVKIAPPRAFPLAANPPVAASPPPVAQSGAGGVNVRNTSAPNKSDNGSWWGFAVFVAFVGFISLMNSGGRQRTATAPSHYGNPVNVQSSSGSRSYESTAESEARQNANRSADALRDWNNLPVLQPASIQLLPGSKKSGVPKTIAGQGAIEFSPDGKRLAYVDSSSTLQILSLPDRKVVRSLALDSKLTTIDALFSPNNETVAVIQRKPENQLVNRIGVWSVRSGKKLGALVTAPEDGSAWPQAVYNNGTLLLCPTLYKPITTAMFEWNPKTGKRSKSPISSSDYTQWNYGVASPDGEEFAVGDSQGTLRWLDLKTGKQKAEHTMTLTQGAYQKRFGKTYTGSVDSPLGIRGLDYSLDGSYLASRSNAGIRVFDSSARSVAYLPIDAQNSMFFSISPGGNLLAAQGNLPYSPEGMVLWNVKTKQITRLEAPFEALLDFGFSPDGKQLYGIFSTSDEQFQMVIWNVNAKPQPTITDSQAKFENLSTANMQFPHIAMAPRTPLAQTDESFAFSTSSSIGFAQKNGGSLSMLLQENRSTAELGLSPDERFLATRDRNGAVQLWDVPNTKSVFQSKDVNSINTDSKDFVVDPENRHALAFSSDNRLWAYARPSGNSSVIELRTLEANPRLLASFPQQEQVTALKFSPDNKALVCGDDTGLLQWFDVATRKPRDSRKTGEPISEIVWGAKNLVAIGDTTQLYQMSASERKPLQNATKVKLSAEFDAGRDAYTPSAISPDGKLLATAQGANTVQIWDLAARTKLQELPRINNANTVLVYGLKFSEDSRQLDAIGQNTASRQIFVKTWKLSP